MSFCFRVRCLLPLERQFQLPPDPLSVFLRIGDRETDEADGMMFAVDLLQELFGEGEDVLQGDEGLHRALAAGDLCEVVELDFQRQGVAAKVVAFQSLHQFGGHVIQFDDERGPRGEVALQRMFAAQGFADAYDLHRTFVNASGEVILELPCLAYKVW